MVEQSPHFGEARERLERMIKVGVKSKPSELHPERNEDAVFADEENMSFGVFDGMSNPPGGEIAAETARDYIREELKKIEKTLTPEEVKDKLKNILISANEKVREKGQTGIGTTASVVKVVEQGGKKYAVVGNIGDSRVYVHKADGKLEQVTIDDGLIPIFKSDEDEVRKIQNKFSNVETKEEYDTLGSDEKELFDRRNEISQYLGKRKIDPRMYIIKIQEEDKIIISSDGIHDNLTDKEMDGFLNKEKNVADATGKLLDEAKKKSRENSRRAKEDDMSLIVVGFSEAGTERKTDNGQTEAEGAEKDPTLGFDLYETLGVPENATPEQMKESIRRFNEHYLKKKRTSPVADEEKEIWRKKNEAYDILSNPEERTAYDNELKKELKEAQEKFGNGKKELTDIIEECKTKYSGKTFKEKTILKVGDEEVEFEASENIIKNFKLSKFTALIEGCESDLDLYKNHDQIEEEINSLIGQSMLLSEHKNILKMLMGKVDEALKLQEAEEAVADVYAAEDEKLLEKINTLRQELGVKPIESVGKIDATDRDFYELVEMHQDNEGKLEEVKGNYKNKIEVAQETPSAEPMPVPEAGTPAAGAEPAAEPVEPTPAEAGGEGEPPAGGPPPPPEGGESEGDEEDEELEKYPNLKAAWRTLKKPVEWVKNGYEWVRDKVALPAKDKVDSVVDRVGEKWTYVEDGLRKKAPEDIENSLGAFRKKKLLKGSGLALKAGGEGAMLGAMVGVRKFKDGIKNYGPKAALYGLAWGAVFAGLLVKNSFKLAWAELKVIWGAVSEHIPGGKNFSRGWDLGRKTFKGKEEKSEKK